MADCLGDAEKSNIESRGQAFHRSGANGIRILECSTLSLIATPSKNAT
jgi:hypothetical protein